MPSLYRYFSEKHAHAFVQKGEVLFRALSYFRNYEDGEVRGDKFEGTLVYLPDNGLVAKMLIRRKKSYCLIDLNQRQKKKMISLSIV